MLYSQGMQAGEHNVTANVRERLEAQLPASVVQWLHSSGRVAEGCQCAAFLVGGAVRDLLLGQATLDLDIAVQGDIQGFLAAFSTQAEARTVAHDRFGTATLQWNDLRVDFAMTRAEVYARPGALPTVRPASIIEDLGRRDFTINSLAVDLAPSRFGELLDPFQGLRDLQARLVRVLHDRSFIDDATRILRALRYERRLGFVLEPQTEALLRRDIPMLGTISGDRLRNEVQHFLEEAEPEGILQRCQEVGALSMVLPGVNADPWLAERFRRLRQHSGGHPAPSASWGLLLFMLQPQQAQELVSRLRLPGEAARIANEVQALKDVLPRLQEPGVPASAVFHLLKGYTESSLQAVRSATDDERARSYIHQFLTELRSVRPALDGNRLVALGVPKGEQVGQLLRALLDLRLDGKLTSAAQEEEYVRSWLERSKARQ